MKMLPSVFLLSFLTGVAICEDNQTMALVCIDHFLPTINLSNLCLKKKLLLNLFYLMYVEF